MVLQNKKSRKTGKKELTMLCNNLKALRKERHLTLEELAKRLGTSKQTIQRYENGIIANVPPEKIEKLAEALAVTPAELMGWSESKPEAEGVLPLAFKKVRLIGDIACGEPIYAEEQYESFAVVGGDVDVDFCLKARGDSMIGARIYDGDIVFIKAQDAVDNGEIAAVIINDEATLKRVYYYPEEEKLILSPENPRYAPLVSFKDELMGIKILGQAVYFQSRII